MKEKINIAELLKDCPSGMELDCTMFDNAYFERVNENVGYPIRIKVGKTDVINLTKYGCWNKYSNAKCVIFPKGKTTWEGFHKSFVDGDIVYNKLQKRICIYSKGKDYSTVNYCRFNERSQKFEILDFFPINIDDYRLATEKERQKLFDAIKTNGYKWNAKNKTLEILLNFKNGDIISNGNYIVIFSRFGCGISTHTVQYYCCYSQEFRHFTSICEWGIEPFNKFRYATKEEKNKLFKAIKDNGYKWNAETKILERLIEPKFKVGDKVKSKINQLEFTIEEVRKDGYIMNDTVYKCSNHVPFCKENNFELVELIEPKFKVGDRIKHISSSRSGIIVRVDDKGYYVDYSKGSGIVYISFIFEKNYELVPNKFDINTLIPFESRVLMRSSNAREWTGTIFSHYSNNKFYGCGMCCDQCIPYEGNEYLIGKTYECKDYYKIWEK